MTKLSTIIFISLGSVSFLIASTSSANVAPKCMSGSIKSIALADQFNDAKKSKIVSQILQKYEITQKPTQESSTLSDCLNCSTSTQNSKSLNELAASMSASLSKPTSLQIKSECIATANKIKANSTYVQCPSEKRKKPPQNECMTEEMIKYQSAAITEILKCVKNETKFPISINSLYEMYTNETGFKPNYSSAAGTGLGQLTSIFVRDIHQKGRGLETLKKIATSSSPQCEGIKNIAEKDLNQQPSFNQKCNFISYGEGFERNILYTLIGMNTLWTKDLEPIMRQYINKHENDKNIRSIKELITLNAYGAGGPRSARAAAHRLTKLKPEKFVEQISKPLKTSEGHDLTLYIQRIKNKQDQLIDLFPANSTINFKQLGSSACIDN
ncbi:MAG: hypothetical protein ACK4VO_02750 [Pseudobdellovibrio sp.]